MKAGVATTGPLMLYRLGQQNQGWFVGRHLPHLSWEMGEEVEWEGIESLLAKQRQFLEECKDVKEEPGAWS